VKLFRTDDFIWQEFLIIDSWRDGRIVKLFRTDDFIWQEFLIIDSWRDESYRIVSGFVVTEQDRRPLAMFGLFDDGLYEVTPVGPNPFLGLEDGQTGPSVARRELQEVVDVARAWAAGRGKA